MFLNMFPLSLKAFLGVRLSFIVVPISVALVSWFIHNRTDNLQIQNKTQETEGNLPKLIRIDPVEVGYVRELNLIPGMIHKMKTLSMRPALFGVISYSEFLKLIPVKKIREIIYYLDKIHQMRPNKRARDSSTAFLDPYEHLDFKPLFESLRDRIHEVTKLPKDMIWSSENMQVVKYGVKQHYHCHFDSEGEEKMVFPCCHQLIAIEEDYQGECLPCRFLTFFYYLNEPEEGGETAFPIADNETCLDKEKMKVEEMHRCDLSEHCYDANIYYKPKRGAALLWYNHFVDEKTGWLGPVDVMSYHGGCDVIKGTKWAANNWINAGNDRQADMEVWEYSRLAEEDFQERMKRHPWEKETAGRNPEEGG